MWKTVVARVKSLHPGCLFHSNRVARRMLFQASLVMADREASLICTGKEQKVVEVKQSQKEGIGLEISEAEMRAGSPADRAWSKTHTEVDAFERRSSGDKRWKLLCVRRVEGRKCITVGSGESSRLCGLFLPTN